MCQIALRFAYLLQKTAVRLLQSLRCGDPSKLRKSAFFDVISLCTVCKFWKERRKTHFFSIFDFFGTDTQSVGLFGTPIRFLLRWILASDQSPKVNLLIGPILGSFSGIAKRGWHLMPPNLAHIISKKLPSFCYINFPEAICGCREKSPVFFWDTLYLLRISSALRPSK